MNTTTSVVEPGEISHTTSAETERWDRLFRGAFRVTAFAEAGTWVAMLTAMLFKYVINGYAFGVTVAGWVHGTVWLAFVAACIAAAIRFRWRVWVAIVGLIMSGFPFLTIPFDFWMGRSGRLRTRRAVDLRESTPSATPQGIANDLETSRGAQTR